MILTQKDVFNNYFVIIYRNYLKKHGISVSGTKKNGTFYLDATALSCRVGPIANLKYLELKLKIPN